MTNNISINIIYIRKKNYLSQKDLGDKFGISYFSISAYERGKNEPPLSFVIAFCKEFEVSIDDFVNKDLSKEKHYKQENVVIQAKEPEAKTVSLYQKIIDEKEQIIKAKNEHIKILEKTNNMLEVLLNQNNKN